MKTPIANPKSEIRSPTRCDGAAAPRSAVRRIANLAPFVIRHSSFVILLCLLTAALYLATPAAAQSYSIDWHTIDGGGGTSTGGVYSVSGTIGQPDASTTAMTDGNYSLTGGFWSLVAIQTPGAPTLTIVPAGQGQAQISWSPDTPGFVLQETFSLSPTNWMNSVSGSTNPVTVPVPGGGKFYRLFKP